MTRTLPTLLTSALVIIGLGACKSRVDANDLDGNGDTGASNTYGELELYARSNQAAEGTESMSMDVGRIEVHVAESDVADEIGGEWLVLSDDVGKVMLVEERPGEYLMAAGTAPETRFDAIRMELTGATYISADGDVFDLDLPEGLDIDGSFQVDTLFCVTAGETTSVVAEYSAELGEDGNGYWLDLDVGVQDDDSC